MNLSDIQSLTLLFSVFFGAVKKCHTEVCLTFVIVISVFYISV